MELLKCSTNMSNVFSTSVQRTDLLKIKKSKFNLAPTKMVMLDEEEGRVGKKDNSFRKMHEEDKSLGTAPSGR